MEEIHHMKFKSAFAAVAASALLVTLGGVGGAVAGDLVTSRDIQNDTIRSIDVKDGGLGLRDLNGFTKNRINQPGPAGEDGADGRDGKDGAPGAQGPAGPAGPAGATGPQGPKGDKGDAGSDGADGQDGRDGLEGAVYRVLHYTNGGGGDATVACADDEETSKQYTAIAGGVEAGHTGSNDFTVTASFPGRMDWNTGEPKDDRLDGWIILGNGEYTDNLKVWALCVPTTSIDVEEATIAN